MYQPKYDKSRIDSKIQSLGSINSDMATINKIDFDNFILERSEYANCYLLAQEGLADRRGNIIEEDFIIRVHSAIDPRSSKYYRISGAQVKCDGVQVYQGPFADWVLPLLQALIQWFNGSTELYIVVKVAIFHYQFVKIHPFDDGNGRTIRFISLLLLASRGYDLTKSGLLMDYFKNNKQEYYGALTDSNFYDFNADLTKWIEYFVEKALSFLIED